MTENTDIVLSTGGPLQQYLPQDGKGLMYLATQVAAARMFQNGQNPLTKEQAFVMMVKGAELGLSPLQSLEHISIIKGKPFVGAAVIAARIRQSPQLEKWGVDADKDHCTITFKRRGEDESSVSTKIDDIPREYFKPSKNGEPSNWTKIPEDMLFSWTVRRVARRHFPDALLDLGDAVRDDTPYVEGQVVNVREVERQIQNDNGVYGLCAKCRENGVEGQLYLRAANSGGAFLACKAGHSFPPPDEVRDAVRGHKDAGDSAPSDEAPKLEVLPPATPDIPAEGRDLTPEEMASLEEHGPAEDAVSPVWTELLSTNIRDHLVGLDKEGKVLARDWVMGHGWDGKPELKEWLMKQPAETLEVIAEYFGVPVPE